MQEEQRRRQQRVAEITEMIHVASLMHDDVIDSANTRRGLQALNSVFGNKVRPNMAPRQVHLPKPCFALPCCAHMRWGAANTVVQHPPSMGALFVDRHISSLYAV